MTNNANTALEICTKTCDTDSSDLDTRNNECICKAGYDTLTLINNDTYICIAMCQTVTA